MDILLVGTDTRAGADSRFGSTADSSGAGNADVMMAVHIYADHQRATVVSIPRDTMAPFPGCADAAGGDPWPAQQAQILNVALKMGGPSCLRKTVGDLTGISFEHFMIVDFHAVIDLSNIVGGVPVCVNQPVDDPASGLKLPAGISTVQGDQALAFLRTRHAFGDASDLARISAQQGFLSALVRKIKTEDTLKNIPKLYSIADTTTQNVTLDTGLASIPALLKLAGSLTNILPANVSFVTVPHEPYVADNNRVQLSQPSAKALFSAIEADQNVTPPAATDAPSTRPSQAKASAPPSITQDPTTPSSIGPFSGQTANQQTCQTASGF